MTALTMIREEIADTYLHGIPTAGEVRRFKALLWPVIAGWDYVVDDSLDHEKELIRLIQLAIEGKDDDGDDPEKKIGRLITELALRRADAEFDDIVSDIGEARSVYQDRPRLLGRTAETFAEWGRSFMGERA